MSSIQDKYMERRIYVIYTGVSVEVNKVREVMESQDVRKRIKRGNCWLYFSIFTQVLQIKSNNPRKGNKRGQSKPTLEDRKMESFDDLKYEQLIK